MGYQVKLDNRWIVFNAHRHPKTCVICLPGRYGHAGELCKVYRRYLRIKKSLIVGVTPTERCWYPMPNGIGDQEDAILGLKPAINLVEEVVAKIKKKFNIPKERILLTGFSAGAVVAIQTAVHSDSPYLGVISHSGAILEPDKLPRCRFPETEYLLTHCRQDLVFEWYERYLPMYYGLRDKGYTVWPAEDSGDHTITVNHMKISKYFVECMLNKKGQS